MATVSGIDVSYWNSGIDWPKVRATGQRFVFIKATEGDNYADPAFDDNWPGAGSAGLLRGAYHFFRANVDPGNQAKKFIDYVSSMDGNSELPPVLDLETHDGQSKEKIIAGAKVWLDEVEKVFSKKPIIYSSQYFLQDYFSEAGGGPPAWAKNYPLWLAQYPNQYSPGMKPFLPTGWFNWMFWQYSKRGSVNGINADVDLNLFNGTLEDLLKLAGAQSVKPSPSPVSKTHIITAGETFESIAIKYGVTVRELASANLKLLKMGDSLSIPVAVAIPAESGTNSPGSVTPPPTSQRIHVVKSGETLYAIAIKYGTTIAAIASINNLSNPNQINVGQVLKLPS